jgi:hypothetical protein
MSCLLHSRGSRRRHSKTRLAPPSFENAAHAALSHIAVSNALLINGMFMPKLLFAALLAAGLTGFSATP